MKYEKPSLSTGEQIELLKQRGLIISSEVRADKYLNTIGYFRLTGYMYHLQNNDGSHNFKETVNFDDIINLYHFDKKLRAIIIDYLERIEILLRAKLTNKFSVDHGFYWYEKQELFANLQVQEIILEKIKDRFDKQQERFLKSFKNKYHSETSPPSNMALETLSFGSLSKVYSSLKNGTEKIEIATEFNLVSSILTSWLIHLTNIRNVCAHHSRLWNRKFTAEQPIIPQRDKFKFIGELPDDFNVKLYGAISIISKMLYSFNKENNFISKIETIIKEYNIDAKFMGFPDDWETNATWHHLK